MQFFGRNGFGTRNNNDRNDLRENLDDTAIEHLHGFYAGTQIGSHLGWRPVEAIAVGDFVMTFDNGMQRVEAVTRGRNFGSQSRQDGVILPLEIPVRVFGNSRPIVLLPEQCVIVESDAGEKLFGDPFSLIPSAALPGFKGVRHLDHCAPYEVVTLHFEKDEVIYAEGSSLIFCPSYIAGTATDAFADGELKAKPYIPLSHSEAKLLLEHISNDPSWEETVQNTQRDGWERAAAFAV
ncbi:Hint domain-containing protein [Aliiroseovarius sp. KMU-50]|uniref:Hint domain-containing protein n=1 Tax=Aliiroseovarius salicola TaxID=3009082 RepID=A0ABT4W286_9RHOB|nr:Hint domain-containing protein [Aliiroseovarius sp. KMU-50]MDA5094636.1 Hint domain-containing protein [Aliiroseovarius sp. KMU-50]